MAHDGDANEPPATTTTNGRVATNDNALVSDPVPLLAILSANIQGLTSARSKHKLGMLSEKAEDENIAIATLTESHLNSNILEVEILMKGYEAFRTDRAEGTRKGGVLTYVRNDVNPGTAVMKSESVGNIEYQMLKIPRLNMIYIAVYRPPTAELHHFEQVVQSIRQSIENEQGVMPNIVLTGDLNLPIIQWEDLTVKGGTCLQQAQAKLLIELFDDFFLEQSVCCPTRGSNILDLFSTNDPDLIANISIVL